MDKTLDDKKYIEELLQRYVQGNLGSYDLLYRFYLSVKRSVSGRVAYEVLKRYEQGVPVISEYGFGGSAPKTGGIPISLKKISRDVWIPENYRKTFAKMENEKTFDIFNQDELNAIIIYPEIASSQIICKVLYCKDKEKNSLGKKLDLFLNDAEWRNDAKIYSRMLLECMQREAHDDLNSSSHLGEFLEDTKEGLKGIIKVTSLYLNEMK